MQQSQFGILLALIGALILTPDSLLMRLSQMDGGAMLAWRATLAGMVFLFIGLNKRSRSTDTSKRIFSKSFVALIICQIANTSFFAFAISLAPVAIEEIMNRNLEPRDKWMGYKGTETAIHPQNV